MSSDGAGVSPSSYKSRFYSRFRDADSDSDEDDGNSAGSGIVDKLTKRRQEQRQMTHEPMSSPVRQRRTETGGQTSGLRGSKYTLRTGGYIPFKKRLGEKRAIRQLQQRGGTEEMEKFVQLQQEREWLEKLRRDAEKYVIDPEHIDEIEEFDESSKQNNIDYEVELELILKEREQEEEEDELDQLFASLELK